MEEPLVELVIANGTYIFVKFSKGKEISKWNSNLKQKAKNINKCFAVLIYGLKKH